MNKVVIEEFYHMTSMDANMNWMNLTHLLSPKKQIRATFSKLIFTKAITPHIASWYPSSVVG
jgi:hypothetical protein